MWQRKFHKDMRTGLASPLPTQIVGNEEFAPMPQTRAQKKVEARIFELADRNAKTLGMSRRDFLRLPRAAWPPLFSHLTMYSDPRSTCMRRRQWKRPPIKRSGRKPNSSSMRRRIT